MPSLHAHELCFLPMNEEHARAIILWRYDAPYDVYNITAASDGDVVTGYLFPENAYFSIHIRLNAGAECSSGLIGYCCFGQDARVPGGEYWDDALDVGLGLRPALTGQGCGREFVQGILDFGRKQYTPQTFRLTVAAFNARAIRVYEELGFQRILEFQRQADGCPFVVMKLTTRE